MGSDERLGSEAAHPTRLLVSNLALVATTAVFMTVAVRAVAVARLNTTTAAAIVQTNGPVNVLVGTLTEGVGEFLSVSLWAFVLVQGRRGPGAFRRGPALLVLSLIGLLLVFVAHWVVFLVTCVITAMIAIAGRPHEERFPLEAMVRPLVAYIALGVALVFLTSSDMWLPQERLQLGDGSAISGYVLEEEGEWMSVLDEAHRELLFVRRREVEARGPCGGESDETELPLARVIGDLFGDPPDLPIYPVCESP